MHRSLLFFFLLGASEAIAQPFAIGSTSITYFDDQRARNVPCEIHYPALSGGTDTPIATGPFPVLVFGHGFVMTVDAYVYLWQHFAPLGYIVVLPTTEGGLAPDHTAFGADLAFLANTLQAANTDGASPFFGQVAAATALMGHSMGGGAAFLGASGNANIQTLITLAPAETNPSAIAAAVSIPVPTLVLAASADCVTPIADHAQPLYDALTVPCKALVNITGGGHCYFGDNSFTCNFGEFTCAPDLTIDRAQQHAVVTDVATLWLDHFLRGSSLAYAELLDTLSASTRFVAQNNCLSTGIAPGASSTIRFLYDEALDVVHLNGVPLHAVITVHTADGRLVQQAAVSSTNMQLPLVPTAAGMLQIVVRDHGSQQTFRLVRMDRH